MLPKVITSGVDSAPTGALALAEMPQAQLRDDGALLAKAAALTVTLPPMPVAECQRFPGGGAAGRRSSQPEAPASGGVMASTAEKLARLFGSLTFGGFKATTPAAASPDDLRGAQQ